MWTMSHIGNAKYLAIAAHVPHDRTMARTALVVALLLSPLVADAKPRWQTLPLPPMLPDPAAKGDVEVAGAQIHYAVYGQGEPVILLHGGLGNSDHFGFQLPALADKFQVVAIDSRGQGRSTRTKATITYDLMATDVIAVLDQLKIERASIVGWSDGGEVALKLGIRYPDRVNRLFVFGANYDSNGSKPRGSSTATFAAYTQKCRADYERMMSTSTHTQKGLHGSSGGDGFDVQVAGLMPLWRSPTGITKEQLREIKAPVLMADGDHDEVIVLAQLLEMSKLIPNAKLAVFKDASHFALWQDPDTFNRALIEFLTTDAEKTTASSSLPPR